MQERMEGLQGWMAEIERKQGRMTYFGAAAAAVAIAASAGALYLGVTTKDDSATNEDVDAIQGQVDAIQGEVKQAVEQELKVTNDKIATLEQTVLDLKKKQAQDAADIATLQSQANSAPAGAGAGAGAGTGVGAAKP
jgi:TolA-binding protein